MPNDSPLSRRALLSGAAILGAQSLAGAADQKSSKIAIFSKHLQFLQGEALAACAAEIGFDGIDITVRKGGHIAPERAHQELPKLVATIRKQGLEVPMITTDIVDSETPFAVDIIETMAELGIHRYRWGGFTYHANAPIAEQLERLKPRVAKLAALNSKYKVAAMYHTHSGVNLVGASIWDLHILLDGLDPAAVGVNYDIGHATIEGGVGGWIHSFRITGQHLLGVAVKDFIWAIDANGKWRTEWTPLGQGMAPLTQLFQMMSAARFSGPLQLHFEYPIGSQRDEVVAVMKRDLQQMRTLLRAAPPVG